MRTSYPMQPLSEVLEPDSDSIEVQASEQYRIAGVLGFGRGVFERDSILGVETKYKKLYRLHTGTLIYSKLKAFEGAIAVVTQPHAGAFVSSEFPTFRPTPQLYSSYLAHICRWPAFWGSIRQHSRGIGARRERLHPLDLMETRIPLPDIDEQRRIASHLDSIYSTTQSIEDRLSKRNKHRAHTLLPSLVDEITERKNPSQVEVGSLFNLVSDVVHPGDSYEDAECFVGLQHIESHTGRRIGSLPLGDEMGRKFRFRPGDVTFGYLAPYLNKVWVADRVGLCSVDQYVLRPSEGVDADLLAYLLRSASTLAQSEELTHNLVLPRLRSKLLAGILVADPRLLGEETKDNLNRVTKQVLRLSDLERRRADLCSSVMPSALNRAFAGLE